MTLLTVKIKLFLVLHYIFHRSASFFVNGNDDDRFKLNFITRIFVVHTKIANRQFKDEQNEEKI